MSKMTYSAVPTHKEVREELLAGLATYAGIDHVASAILALFAEKRGHAASAAPDNDWQKYAKEYETAQTCIERHRAEHDALLELLKKARSVAPHGYKLVPIEPTKEMKFQGSLHESDDHQIRAKYCYKAMVAAAPTEAKSKEDEDNAMLEARKS